MNKPLYVSNKLYKLVDRKEGCHCCQDGRKGPILCHMHTLSLLNAALYKHAAFALPTRWLKYTTHAKFEFIRSLLANLVCLDE